jgi:hypothetical protein
MMETQAVFHAPYNCGIEVRGCLDSRSMGRFNGLSVRHDGGTSVLGKLIESQLDLCGYLLELASLHLSVAALSCSEIGEEDLAAELKGSGESSAAQKPRVRPQRI